VIVVSSWLHLVALLGPASAADLTFNKDVAPLLWTHCASCHRPGSSAPFSLIDYADVVPRIRPIVTAIKTRAMPPWLPEPGYGEFANARGLTAEEVDRIAQWVAQGAPQGPASDLPPKPQWTEGWQLGTPDLVVSLPQTYTVPAGPTDVFRTFVIPVPLVAARYVRGVELRPGNRRIVHHASMAIDRTRGSRRLDEADPAPGFAGGMLSQGVRSPEGRAIGWTPGITPRLEPEGMAWLLESGTDLVVQLHMLPSTAGEAEQVQPSVGFYFSEAAPTRAPVDFKLGSKTIDIEAGRADYVIEDSYVLPVDVELLSVYPHAHYLAKEMKASAALPTGEVVPLLWIRDWDFHWQDEYRYVEPPSLPAGTRVEMRYTYDNTAANQNDRSRPPSRVAFGPQSSDEMGDLWLRLLPRTSADALTLARAYMENEIRKDIDAGERLIRAQPRDAKRYNALALSYVRAGRIADAMARLQDAVRLAPDTVEPHNNLGHVLQLQGKVSDALEHYREAVRIAPGSDLVHLNLANALQELDQIQEAIPHFEQAIALNPAAADAHNNLGVALGSLGRLDEAAVHFRQALEIRPDYGDALDNLRQVLQLLKQGR
jgi:tetratricopeptide (TPR) repeat protein